MSNIDRTIKRAVTQLSPRYRHFICCFELLHHTKKKKKKKKEHTHKKNVSYSLIYQKIYINIYFKKQHEMARKREDKHNDNPGIQHFPDFCFTLTPEILSNCGEIC